MAVIQASQIILVNFIQALSEQLEQALLQLQQTQTQLGQSEARFRSLFEQSADALMLADQAVIVDCNQATVELFGYASKQDLLSLHPAQLSPDYQPDGCPSFEKANAMLAVAYETGSHRFEWVHRHQNGKDLWVEILLTAIEIDEKKVLFTTLKDITVAKHLEEGRKQAEKALRHSEARFQKLTANLPGMVYQFRLSADGYRHFSYISLGCRDHYGLEPEIFLNTPDRVFEVTHPDDRAAMEASIRLSAQTLQPWRHEYRIIMPSGQTKWLQGHSRPERQQNGDVVWDGITIDISDRKQAEELLRQQAAAMAATRDGVAILEGDKFIYMNQAHAEILGYSSPNDFLGQTWHILYHPPELDRFKHEVFPTLQQQGHWFGEAIGKRRDGSTFAEEISLTFSETGHLICTCRDINDRKQAEEALRTSEQQLREQAQRERLLNRLTQQIRNSLDFDIALTTALTEIQSIFSIDRAQFAWYYANAEDSYWEVVQEACHSDSPDLTGRYPASTVGLLAEKLLRLEILRVSDVERVDDPVWKAFVRSLNMRAVLIIPMQMPSGAIGVISCADSNKPHDWQDDEVELLEAVMGQLAIALNQANLYAQSRAKAHELEQTLHELQRTQAQMLQSEKMSSLGQLVAGVAHEINNPVNFIYGNLNYASDYIQDLLGLVQLYQRHYPQPTAAVQAETEAIDLDFLMADLPKLLNSMRVGADRIQKIVASLRTFSRMDEAEVKSVNLHEGIDSTLLILQHRLKKKDDRPAIKVVRNYGSLSQIECYAGQLNQVFMNLIGNAIDALEDALKVQVDLMPTITIQTQLIDRFVEIEIGDNGLGIPESIQQRLFDPFFTTKPLGSGTGMGLSISYQIVADKHGGSIECFSRPEAGATFTIKIPVRQTSRPKLLESSQPS